MPKWLDEVRRRWERWLGWNWYVTDSLLGFLGGVLAGLFLTALCAAVALLLRTIGGADGSLGTGALIVAILSVPLVVYNTYLKHRALGFQKEGHLTDRLAKAVEQLGAEKTVKRSVKGEDGKPVTQETTEPNLEVRMGGLLSLERIAQDSTAYDKGRDHVRVMEIICAYIRHNAPASKAQEFGEGELDELPEDASKEQVAKHLEEIKRRNGANGSLKKWTSTLSPPRDDIMLALTILGRRSPRQRRIEAAHGQEGVVEANWVFDQPCPTLPDDRMGQPVGRDARETFRDALKKWQSKLWEYPGYRLDLRDCCLQRAALDKFRLGGALLAGTRLEGANLFGARLEGADLAEARLDETTDLRAADFSASALRKVDLSSVAITQEQINAGFGDGSVTLPDGINRPGHWPTQELEWEQFNEEWRRWADDPENYIPPPLN